MAHESKAIFRPLADLQVCFAILTRIPLRHVSVGATRTLGQAAWAFPLVGLVVGLVGSAIYAAASFVGLSSWIAATLAVGAEILATGGFHEDGLADIADGFGGGHGRDEKLAIMRDSRVGVFGVLALILGIALRLGALVVIARPVMVLVALVAAGALSRAAIVWAMAFAGPARSDGLGAAAGRAEPMSALAATAIALVATVVIAGINAAFLAGVAGFGVGLAVLWLAIRQIGGTTGDVYGVIQQAAEIAALLALSRVLG
ncbi:MAG: adenosylcobinamide-GDP ribazoletransferase [Alphaproteobacteria bacterium]|nr:adenosylcobinamide-GDP ribazoletransferase [Alphaproteobacteria bacterium]